MAVLEFLGSWLASTVLTEGAKITASRISSAVAEFRRDPASYGYQASLTERDERLLASLSATTPTNWKKSFLQGPLVESRPIAILGPSGTGKSIIASRIAGRSPAYAPRSSSKLEREKMVAGWKGLNIFVSPGSQAQDTDGSTIEILQKLTSDAPPKVLCIVVSGGYHATNARPLIGSYKRPGSQGQDVAKTTEEFTNHCLHEELNVLDGIAEACFGKMRVRIPHVLTVINKKDLWLASGNEERTRRRYADSRTAYGKRLSKIRNIFGLGGSPADHEIIECYSFAGGFHPDREITSLALTEADSEADAMVLRALVHYLYREGAVG